MVDLHVHSTYSDGSLTPEQLVDEALRVGLTAVALTDHDSMNGIPAFMEACERRGMRGVPGVEISVEFNPGTMHMLGYWVNPHHDKMAEALARIRGSREDRNQAILAKLNALGFDLKWDEVAAYAGEDVVGRPHFAQALHARGAVTSKQEAFERFLAKGKPAYADRYRLSPQESIPLILAAGGVPVLAHPATLDLSRSALHELVKGLRSLGLQGLEAYYSEHSAEQESYYVRLAKEFDLVTTGGSDFHGIANPSIRLGAGFGSLNVPDSVVDTLHARIQTH